MSKFSVKCSQIHNFTDYFFHSKVSEETKIEFSKLLNKKTSEKDFFNFKSEMKMLQKESELGWRVALGEIGNKIKKDSDVCKKEISEFKKLLIFSAVQ